MNITITGNLGSGKTSVCNELKKKGFEIISAGEIFREVAHEKGVSVVELNDMCKKDPHLDFEIDERSRKLGKEKDNVVFDSRMAWNFVDNSFKVFLLVNTQEAAKRVYEGENRNAESYSSLSQAADKLRERAILERDRFKDLYHLDYYNSKNYNLIIESTNATPEQIADEILRNFELYKKENFNQKIELNPTSLYPTQNFSDLNEPTLTSYLKIEQENTTNCSLRVAPVALKNGFFFLMDAHHHTFMAAYSGKVFIPVEVSDVSESQIYIPSKSAMYDYEDLGNIRYSYYPENNTIRSDYMFEFCNSCDISKKNEIENSKKNISEKYNVNITDLRINSQNMILDTDNNLYAIINDDGVIIQEPNENAFLSCEKEDCIDISNVFCK